MTNPAILFNMNSHQNNLAATPGFLTMSFDMVTVRVGKANVAADIPVNLQVLTAMSRYFRSAFEGGFKEATESTVLLDDVTEQTFRIFIQWAHAQLFSSGPTVLVPPRTILGRTATEEPAANANDQDDGEEDDEDSNTSSFHSDAGCYCSFCSPSHNRSDVVFLMDETNTTNGEHQCKDTYFNDKR
jgi:hypothetical protein